VNVQGKAGSARVSINPIVDIRAQLLRNPDAQVFTVRTNPSSAGSYWRIAADDVFNGRQWSPSDPDLSHGVPVDGPALPAGASQPNGPTVTVIQHFQFAQFFQPELPAAFQPVRLDLPGVRVRYDPRSGVLFDPNGTHPDYSYNVTSVEANPAPVQLDGVASLAGPDLAYYTKLPSSTPREIYTIAQTIADSQPNVYRKILAIQDYLRGFRYSLDVRPGHSTSDILHFLKVTKAGYCEQFAGSMAVLLRALGIPARVAVGFTPGTYDSVAQVWRVASRDAHAWVEVPFPDFGWLAFEPTPGRANPAAGYTAPPAQTAGASGGNVTPACRLFMAGGRFNEDCKGETKPVPREPQTSPVPGVGRGTGGRDRSVTSSPVAARRSARSWGVIAVLALLGLMVLAIPALKLVRRRLALARASDPRQRVLAAYVVLAGRAADVGWGRLPPETLFEYRKRLKARMSLDGDLDRVIELTGRAAYGESNISGEQADLATASARRVAHEIRKSAGLGKQLAGWFRLQR
jgi:transglutaminase-like putative cysteine protease